MMRNSLLIVLQLLFMGSIASHFRSYQASWRRVEEFPGQDLKDSTTVEWTVAQAWRTSIEPFKFGDGSTVSLSGGTSTTGADLDGQTWTYYVHKVTHRYAAKQKYYAQIPDSCCRLSELKTGGDKWWRVRTSVNLQDDDNLGSATAFLPAIVNFPIGTNLPAANDVDLSPVENDAGSVTCRKASATEIGYSTGYFTSFYEITSDCVLKGKIPGTYNVGDKFAVQIIMESRNPSDTVVDTSAFDFVIQAVQNPPSCTLLNPTPVVGLGQSVALSFDVDDQDSSSLSIIVDVSSPYGTLSQTSSIPISENLVWTLNIPFDVTLIGTTQSLQVRVSDGTSEAICNANVGVQSSRCMFQGLTNMGTRPHLCQCVVGDCDGAFCNTETFVRGKLSAGNAVGCDAGRTCCCSCPNCVGFDAALVDVALAQIGQ